MKKDVRKDMRTELQSVEQYLPHGYGEEISERLKNEVSAAHVRAVRSGSRSTPRILHALIVLAKEERDKIQKSIDL